MERGWHKEVLRVVAELIFADKAHKDRSSARRRREWDIKNSRGIAVSRWFRLSVRHSLIVTMGVNGLIPTTLDAVCGDQISEEGAAGTVDSACFGGLVENFLVLILSRHELSERRSIAVMDNVSTHTSDRLRQRMSGAGAHLLHTTPC